MGRSCAYGKIKPELGADREVKEEIGLDVKEDELEDLILQAEEVVDARFVSFEELLQLKETGELIPVKRFSLYKKEIVDFINKQ